RWLGIGPTGGRLIARRSGRLIGALGRVPDDVADDAEGQHERDGCEHPQPSGDVLRLGPVTVRAARTHRSAWPAGTGRPARAAGAWGAVGGPAGRGGRISGPGGRLLTAGAGPGTDRTAFGAAGGLTALGVEGAGRCGRAGRTHRLGS